MRVGILTFHEIYNPGAYLQAYATIRMVEELGHDPLIIDYTSPPHRFRPWRTLLLHPKILVHLRDWYESRGRNSAFANSQKYLKKTQRVTTRAGIRSERFDAILVGADIVWNYELCHLGRDPAYFGEDLQTERLIAFAPSCGSVSLRRPIPEFVRSGLHRFSAIAVRDEVTATLVQQVLGTRPQLIADPTLALNLTSLPEWHSYDGDYLLVYALADTVDAETRCRLKRFANARQLKTVAVCYRQNWVDENHVCANPFEWLHRIRCARYVFTGTFHGTIFALKMGKAFVTQYNRHIESKTRPMMEALGRQDRVCGEGGNVEYILEAQWDVDATHRKMDAMAQAAKSYLRRALTTL